jgi:hypothetical protein
MSAGTDKWESCNVNWSNKMKSAGRGIGLLILLSFLAYGAAAETITGTVKDSGVVQEAISLQMSCPISRDITG